MNLFPRPTCRLFPFGLRTILVLVAWQVVPSVPFAASQEPPEPIDTEGQVTLSLARSKHIGPLSKTPSFTVMVNNDTDKAVRIPRLYFGKIELDGQWYRYRRIPFLGDGGDEIEHPPRSETEHGTLDFTEIWGRSSPGESPNAQRKWTPIAITPGVHLVRFHLNGKTTNELRFTVENKK